MKATVFDTETTGLILNRTVRREMWPEVIEFSSVSFDWDTGEELGDYTTLVKPKARITEETTKRNHITNDMVNLAPPFADVADRIRFLLEGSDAVIAHNASFDVEMIDLEFSKMDQLIQWPRTICTVEQTVDVKGRRLTLTELYEHLFGGGFEGAHRAEADVRALMKIVLRLREDGRL